MISGGDITSPLPITDTMTIDPKGTEASSSGIVIQNKLSSAIPIIQGYIDNPSKDKSDDSIEAIDDIQPLVIVSIQFTNYNLYWLTFLQDLFGKIGSNPDPSQKSCQATTKLISSLFNAISCLADKLEKITSEIEISVQNNFEDIEDIAASLERATRSK